MREFFMHFLKMQGCGNDFVVTDGREQRLTDKELSVMARKLCDRRYGIGADGVLVMKMGRHAPFEMMTYNPDGSRAEMCGNGIRCAGKFLLDGGWTSDKRILIESMGLVRTLEVLEGCPESITLKKNNGETWLSVDVGLPTLEPGSDEWGRSKMGADPWQRDVEGWKVGCVSVGNPHAVVLMEENLHCGRYVSDASKEDVTGDGMIMEKMDWERDLEETKALNEMKGVVGRVGPILEHAREFPNRTNVEFVRVIDKRRIAVRTWERGVGETLACGTGACAAACVCMQKGLTDEKITVTLLGGKLLVSRDPVTGVFHLTGPAVTVFEGEINV